MPFESFLKGAEGGSIRKVLDRPDGASVALSGKSQAGSYSRPIHEYRARAADTVLTPQLDARKFLVVPQMVGQGIARVHCDSSATSVYFHVNFDAI
ncbi:hypothetical protein ABIC98_002644 [Arthrobacter nitrophenolicus]|uniref:Uncharacterized protein n=1 Tax=Arthrobacter nitrophenolicus TaxID=683150 RepID=A0ACC6TGY9_9MICC